MTSPTKTDTDKLVEMAKASGAHLDVTEDFPDRWCFSREQLAAFRAAIIAELCGDVEPVGHMWQHGETGATGFVERSTPEEREFWERINKPRRFVCDVYFASTIAALKANHSAEVEALKARIAELEKLINTPHTDDFFQAVQLEAAHQQERWGVEHDAGKAPHDWFWLLGYLGGKALAAFGKGDKSKGLHHIISSAACLLNWHRHVTGEMTAMRPGIAPPDAAIAARGKTA